MNVAWGPDDFVRRAARGDMVAVKLFLAGGMSPDVRNRKGVTPLIAAAYAGRLEVAGPTPRLQTPGMAAPP